MEWLFIVVFLLAIALVLIIARPKKPEGAATEDRAALPNYSNYITQALQFLEFYETLPQKSLFVITPTGIGVAIGNEDLGRSIGAYLTSAAQRPAQAKQLEAAMVASQAKRLGGDKGTRLYGKLGLSATLHNNDVDWPFLSMALPEPDGAKRTRYGKDIQKIYQQMYGKRLDVHHLSAY